VFWHRQLAAADDAGYERAQLDFHASLAQRPPAGFLASRTFRVPELPWLANGGYEDWYLVEDYSALGILAAGAVDASHHAAHAAAAQAFGEGRAGLYALEGGDARDALADGCDLVQWSDTELRAAYFGDSEPGPLSRWRRQLVLSPTPEFCIAASSGAPAAAADADAVKIERKPL
jgi:hypothetical protein